MNVLIIEDEIAAARDLKHMLIQIQPDLQVLDIIDSVKDAILWLRQHSAPDLIFSDIQLADGLSFEIFETVSLKCPVIFCTAFDEYAIRAFDAHGIAYILKPFNEEKLRKSLERYRQFNTMFSDDHTVTLKDILKKIHVREGPYKNNFLVSFGEKMIPLDVHDIACFYTENGVCRLFTHQNKSYPVNYTLEQLEEKLNPQLFFRANRQYIISFKSIEAVEPYFSRKLFVRTAVKVPQHIIVSKQKASSFLQWMEGNH
ncbi:LytR/AlgR family response regulator transcription factor [Sinomicrobium sp. M5D2P17]